MISGLVFIAAYGLSFRQERSLKPSVAPKSRDSTQRPLVNSPGESPSRTAQQKPPNTAPVQRKMKK